MTPAAGARRSGTTGRRGRWPRRLALYAAVLLVCAVVVFPIYWMALTSVRPTRHTMSYPPHFLPEEVHWDAWLQLPQAIPITRWLANTAAISLGTTAVCLVLSTPAAYGLSAFRFRGRGLAEFLLLATQMLPEALLVIPVFIMFRKASLLDSLAGLVIIDAAFVIPIATWVFKGFFDALPGEIQEAALVDGCTRLGVLSRIVLPLSVPAVMAVSVVAFFEGWNEYLFASTFITSKELGVASIGLASFIGELATPVEIVFSAATLFSVPPIIFYLLMQRHIVSGLTGGAVKG